MITDQRENPVHISICRNASPRHNCEMELKQGIPCDGLNPLRVCYAPAESAENDSVNHPNHYTSGGIECIDAIRASLGNKEFADYCKGNVIKYVWRYRHKNGVEDLKKARVYLNWMIESEEVT